MHAMVFNTRQKVAILAVGLTVATTGVVTREAVASSKHPAPTALHIHAQNGGKR
jgi:hypothetical protein